MFTDDQIQTMRDFLARKLAKSNHPRGVHIQRREVEGWGINRAMGPEDAILLLAGSKGLCGMANTSKAMTGDGPGHG